MQFEFSTGISRFRHLPNIFALWRTKVYSQSSHRFPPGFARKFCMIRVPILVSSTLIAGLGFGLALPGNRASSEVSAAASESRTFEFSYQVAIPGDSERERPCASLDSVSDEAGCLPNAGCGVSITENV